VTETGVYVDLNDFARRLLEDERHIVNVQKVIMAFAMDVGDASETLEQVEPIHRTLRKVELKFIPFIVRKNLNCRYRSRPAEIRTISTKHHLVVGVEKEGNKGERLRCISVGVLPGLLTIKRCLCPIYWKMQFFN
jgi:hypothetical protein